MGIKYLIGLTFALTLSGCGGGSGSGTPSGSGGGGSSDNASPSGIWSDVGSGNVTDALIALIDENNDALFYFVNQPNMFECNMVVSGNSFECNPGDGFLFTGEIDEGESISVSLSVNDTEQSSYVLFDNGQYAQPVSMTQVEGIWSETSDGITETLTIDSDGEINGSDTDGCIAFGSITVPDEQKNMQNITVEYSSCDDKDGSYSGKSYLISEDSNSLRLFLNGDTYFKDSTYISQ